MVHLVLIGHSLYVQNVLFVFDAVRPLVINGGEVGNLAWSRISRSAEIAGYGNPAIQLNAAVVPPLAVGPIIDGLHERPGAVPKGAGIANDIRTSTQLPISRRKGR